MNVDDIALTLEPGLNYAAVAHLLELFGSAGNIYRSSQEELTGRGELREDIARNLLKKRFHTQAEREQELARRTDVSIVPSTSPLYPGLLRECADYPHVLYVKGDPSVLQAPMLSMVGSRKVNTYGLSACHRLIEGLAQAVPELVIVSGLAFGIDVACHRAALSFGLRTVAVMATPIDMIYPTSHSGVAADMVARGGALVTELNSKDNPNRARFLQRNRIIAGMSPGTVVVQSAEVGGSMVTASIAESYSRCVMCPPANIGEEQSAGTNRLLRTMRARMVCSAADIMEELGWNVDAVKSGAAPITEMPREQRVVYDCICDRPKVALETIAEITGVALQELFGILLELEFGGYIRPLPGNRYEKF